MASESSSAPGKRSGSTRVTQILLAITVLGLLVFVGSVGLTAYLFTRADRGDVTTDSFLHVELSGPIPDAPVQGGLFLEPEDFPPVVSEVSGAIREAADDDRIEGVYLELDNPVAGWASHQEIRDALGDLRAADKPCVAYSEGYTSKQYYLASACDAVVLAPSGMSMVKGLEMTVTYLAGTFEKLGVEAEFEHVGDFKSAVEPYERTGPSESAAEAYEGLVGSLYDQMVEGIAEGRQTEPEQVRTWIDDLQLTPDAALDRGMVDALAFPDAVVATLPGVRDEGWKDEVTQLQEPLSKQERKERLTPLHEYVKEMRAEQRRSGPRVAVVHAEGPIQSGDGDDSLFGRSAVLADGPFREWMRQVREDDSVKAVVIRVSSPGGSGLASDMMWHEIERVKSAGKPVVVSMGDYAASGGYYIASNADWIVAHPATLTGSIGVFGGKFNLAGTYDKIGVHTATFKRGDLADLLAADQGFSEQGRETFRGYLQSFYDHFLSRVAEGREMSVDEVHVVAQGRVWTGAQALDRDLVDELGGLDVAIAKAADLAQITGDHGIRRIPEQKSFMDLLMEDLSQASAPTVQVELLPEVPGAEDALREALLVTRMARDNGVLMYLPGQPTIE